LIDCKLKFAGDDERFVAVPKISVQLKSRRLADAAEKIERLTNAPWAVRARGWDCRLRIVIFAGS
jgi:hypothetical protein